jgi:CDP-diacylglycerol--glycerol-3-phosphate 3-phosphatidyltransferase
MFEKFTSNPKILHPYDRFCRFFFPLIPQWVKPNHLTIIRFLGTPFLGVLLGYSYYLSSLVLFIFLALTDMFDGALARGRNQITYFGILFDPIADKLLIGVTVAVLLFKVNIVLACVIIGLELLFLIGGLIKTSRKKAVDLEANLWGKVKMNVQVLSVLVLFFGLIFSSQGMVDFSQYSFWFSSFLAVGNFVSKIV